MKFDITNFKILWNYIKYIVIFCLLALLADTAFLFFNYNLESNNNNQKIAQQLTEVSNSKINQLKSYFKNVENEINDLSISNETRSLLKQPLINDETVTKINVDQQSEIIYQEINNYIKSHPQKTLIELQNDPVFQKIAVQTIGDDGYSLVMDYTSQIIAFHKYSEFVGQGYKNSKVELSQFYKILAESRYNPDISGFYKWKDRDGRIRNKYAHMVHINSKTADGVGLMLVSTGYIDNYEIVKDTIDNNSQLYEGNVGQKDFNNLFLINADGYVIYSKDINKNIGINVNWSIYQGSTLSKNFDNVQKENKIVFSDAFIDSYGEIYPEFMALSPVYESDKFLGYIALVKNMNSIFDITKDIKNLGETGESYLVNRDNKLLISPLRRNYFDMFVQTINTDNINNCFADKPNTNNLSLNYNGDQTVAVHASINQPPWCLVTEIKDSEVLKLPLIRAWLISIGLFLFFFLNGILVTIKINQNPNPKDIKVIIKLKKFISQLEIKKIVIFSLVFVFCYFLIVTSFFQGFSHADFYNDIPDLFTILILTILFFYGFKLKDIYAQQLISQGSFLAIVDRLIQIILEEYNYKFGLISTYFWLPGTIIGFIGLFLIFYGFKREKKL
jgi:hypothetical protein